MSCGSTAANRAGARAGTTLVEVMVGCVILAILAIAVGASLQASRAMTVVQRDRRAALEIANSRLEAVRAAPYASIRPSSSNFTAYFLSQSGSLWRVTSANPGETARVNGRTRPMTTTVRYVDADGGAASYDCVQVWVGVQYTGAASNLVILETVESP